MTGGVKTIDDKTCRASNNNKTNGAETEMMHTYLHTDTETGTQIHTYTHRRMEPRQR